MARSRRGCPVRADLRIKLRGFTLIEVLVALIVVSLGMLAVIQTVGQTANNSTYMRDKTVAHWIAMNQLTEVRLQPNPPPIDKSSDEIEMSGRDWRWTMEVKQTAIETIRRIDIRVRLAEAPETSSLVTVSGFYGSAVAPPGTTLINWAGAQGPGSEGGGGQEGVRPGGDSETNPPPPQPDPAEPEEDSPGLPDAEPDS
jgi:general secretion pathway protein I